MDVNGLPMLAHLPTGRVRDRPRHGQPRMCTRCQWRRRARHICRSTAQQTAPAPAEDETFAPTMAHKPSPVRDAGGSFAWWDGATRQPAGGGLRAGAVPVPISA